MLSKSDIQRIRALREKKHRETQKRFVIENEKVVSELLSANDGTLSEIYATAGWLRKHNANLSTVPATEITAAEMARISHYPTPSSVLALGKIRKNQLADGDLSHGLTLALDGIQDAGNVGTLLRIADWFGFARVLLSENSADLFSQKVIDASMGSFVRVNAHRVNLPAALSVDKLPPILGCDLNGDDIGTLEKTENAIVVIGSEGRGISPEVRQLVTRFVTIPKYGAAESLNAAAAAAIVCHRLRSL